MNQEHRSTARLPIELLAEVRWEDQDGSGEAREGRDSDPSGNGAFRTTPDRPGPETSITFSIFFPAEITGTSIELVGRGRVVRQSQVGTLSGISAVIDEYELRASVPDA